MAGFMSGFGQGFANLPAALDHAEARKQQMQLKSIAMQRQKQLDDTKAMGDIISGLNTALETTPDEAVPNRIGLFFSQIENQTGKKINPAVKQEFLRDPNGAVKSMAQLYGETGGFDANKIGEVLSNPQAFAGVYDALNRRQAATKAAAAFTQGATGNDSKGQAPEGNDLQRLDQQFQVLNQQAATLANSGLDPKELAPRMSFLEKRMSALQDQRKLAFENATMLAARRLGVTDISKASPAIQQAIQADVIQQSGLQEKSQTEGKFSATPLPFEAAQATQVPFGTTYGDIRNGGQGGASGGLPSPSPQAPLGIRNNNPGNLRPVGASTGFQQFSSMQEGLQALDKDLQIKGGRGVNTIRKVISAWAPPSENNTEAYIKTVAQRLGVPPDAALDMENPLVRQALSTAISLHENGSKALLAPNQGRGVQGGPTAPGQSLVPPTAAQQGQDKFVAEKIAKDALAIQDEGMQAGKNAARMQQLGSFLDKVDTGSLTGTGVALARYAKAAGFEIPASATYAETAKALAIPLIGEMRGQAGLAGSMSNYEDQLLQSAIPNIDKLPGTNKILVKAYVAQQQRAQDIAKLVRDYRKDNGKYDEGIYDKVAEYKDKNPIFSAADAKTLIGENRKTKSSLVPQAPTVSPFADPDKEARYQAWKKSQGK